MKTTFRSISTIILILFCIPLIVNAQETELNEMSAGALLTDSTTVEAIFSAEDERITVSVDSLERADTFPDKLKNPNQNNTYRLPKKGKDFVFIYITVNEKVDLKVSWMQFRLTKSNVIDKNGKQYFAINQVMKNVGKPNRHGFIIFELPKNIIPIKLNYVYQYRDEKPKRKKIKLGQIDLNLIN